MDNIFDILITIFIIFSFISGIFTKKKNIPQTEEVEYGTDKPKKIPKKKDGREFLEEILGIKLPDIENSESDKQSEKYSAGYNNDATWNPEDDFKEVIVNNETKKSTVKDRNIEKNKYNYEPSENKTQPIPQKSILSSILFTEKIEVNERAIDIKNQLLTKKSIKNSILLSEILQKPKALRR